MPKSESPFSEIEITEIDSSSTKIENETGVAVKFLPSENVRGQSEVLSETSSIRKGKSVEGSLNTCIQETFMSYVIRSSKCESNVERELPTVSKNDDEFVYIFEIVELRGLFFDIFEYILYQFEKRFGNVDKIPLEIKNNISAEIEKKRFMEPDYTIEKKIVELRGLFFDIFEYILYQFEKRFGNVDKMSLEIKNNISAEIKNFHNIKQLRFAVIKFYKHLCDILFPKGFENLTPEEQNMIADTELKNKENEEIGEEQKIVELRGLFFDIFEYILYQFKKRFGKTISPEIKNSISAEIEKIVELRGLFFDIFEYILYQFEKRFGNVDKMSLEIKNNISAEIEISTKCVKLKTVANTAVNIARGKMNPELVSSELKNDEEKEYTEESLGEAERKKKEKKKGKKKEYEIFELQGVFLDVFEYILYQFEKTTQNIDELSPDLKKNISSAIADFYGIQDLQPAMGKFNEHLCDILFPKGLQNFTIAAKQSIKEIRSFEIKEEKDERNKGKKKEEEEEALFSPYVEGSTQNYKIIKVFDIVAKTKSLEPSTSFTEITPQRSFQEIGELRGLFLEFIEYILYRFEKTNPEAANQFPSTRKTAISSAINEHDDLIIIDRFQKTVHGLFSIYEQRIEPTEYYEQRHIRRQQIQEIVELRGLFFYVFEYILYQFEKTIQNVNQLSFHAVPAISAAIEEKTNRILKYYFANVEGKRENLSTLDKKFSNIHLSNSDSTPLNSNSEKHKTLDLINSYLARKNYQIFIQYSCYENISPEPNSKIYSGILPELDMQIHSPPFYKAKGMPVAKEMSNVVGENYNDFEDPVKILDHGDPFQTFSAIIFEQESVSTYLETDKDKIYIRNSSTCTKEIVSDSVKKLIVDEIVELQGLFLNITEYIFMKIEENNNIDEFASDEILKYTLAIKANVQKKSDDDQRKRKKERENKNRKKIYEMLYGILTWYECRRNRRIRRNEIVKPDVHVDSRYERDERAFETVKT
ncbi:hypothetical protein PGB90_002660 [Kerria lacca]